MAFFDEKIYREPEFEEFVYGFEYEMLYPLGWKKMVHGKTIIDHPELEQFKTDRMKIAHAITRVKR